MALIKKHSAGGKADFREFVVTKLLTDETLSAREQENISKELSSFESTVEGHEDMGDFSGGATDDKTSAWLNKAKKEFGENTPKQVQLMPEGGWGPETRSPEGFGKYLQRTLYGDNEHTLVRAIGSMTDNNKIKQYVIKNAKDYTRDYVNRAYQENIDRPDNEWHNKQEMEQAQNVLATIDETKAINDDDWNAVVDSLRKLGESPEEFLRSPQELEEIEKKRIDNEEKINWENKKKSLENLGLDEELVKNLEGFSVNTDYEPFENTPFLQEAIKKGGYNLIQSADKSTHALVKDGKIVKDAAGLISDDQLNEHFGKTWGSNEQGVFTIFDKDQIDSNTFFDKDTVGEDKFKNLNVSRQILTKDPKFDGYEIKGYSGDNFQGNWDKDIFGRRQFTKEFTFTKDGETFKVIRGDDGVYRKEGEDTKFTMPKDMSYGEEFGEHQENLIESYVNNPGSPLYSIIKSGKDIPKRSRNLDMNIFVTQDEVMEKAKKRMKTFEDKYEQAIKTGKDVNIKALESKRLAEFLKYVLTSGEHSPEQIESAKELINRFTILANKEVHDKESGKKIALFDTPMFMWRAGGVIEHKTEFDLEKFRKWKEGGVLKAQQGSTMEDFLNTSSKLAKGREKRPVENIKTAETKTSGYSDPTGTVGDSNALDWVSTAGTVGSFIPVIGAIGGLVSTGADAANALIVRGDWTKRDTVNLLSNLGFTALAAVGLGAAKGVKMAGTAAKTAKTLNVGKKASKTVNTVLKNVNNLRGSSIGKNLGRVAAGAQIVGGASGAVKIAGNVADEGHLWEGIKKSQMGDVNRVLQAGAIGYGMRQNVLGKRAIDSQTEVTYGKSPTKVLNVQSGKEVKTYNLSDAPKTAKFNPNTRTKKVVNKAGKLVGKDPSTKDLDSYKEELVGLLDEKQFKEVAKALDAGASTSYTSTPGTITKRTLMPPRDISNPAEVKANQRARKILERGSGNYFTRMGKKQEVLTGQRTVAKPTPKVPDAKNDKIKSTINSIRMRQNKSLRTNRSLKPKKPEVWTQGSLFKKGGTISYQIGGPMLKIARDWKKPSVFNTQFTTPTLEDYIKRSKNPPLTTAGGYSVQAEKPKYSYDSSKEYTGAVKTTEDPGLLVDQYGHISWDRDKFKSKNLGPLFEAGRLAVSEAHNKSSSALRTRGIIESVPKLSGISSTHLRTSAPLTMEAYRQAGDIQSGARRVGRTVNMNDSMSAMLTGQKNASDLIMRAVSEDANRNKGIQDQQMAIDRETMAHNTAVANQQSEIGGRARQAIYNEAAGLKQKTGENYSAFLAGLKRESADKPRRTLFDRYVTEMQDPNIEGAREWYGQMTADEKIAGMRNNYNKRQESLKKANINHVVTPYEQSQEYLNYIKHVNKQVAPITTKMGKVSQIASLLSLYSPNK